MVKIIKVILIALCLLVCSCNRTFKPIKEQITFEELEEKGWTKEEIMRFQLWRLLESYTGVYVKTPKTAGDLIVLIERMDESYQMQFNDIYQYLKKHGNRLIFVTAPDSTTTVYEGKVRKNRIVETGYFTDPCHTVSVLDRSFYDEKGYILNSEELGARVTLKLRELYLKNKEELFDDKNRGHKANIEYLPTGFRNLCTGNMVAPPYKGFYSDLSEYFDEFMKEYKLSRIIVGCYIPLMNGGSVSD